MEYPFLIVGMGNCLLGDDGVGIHAVRLLQSDPPPGTRVLDVGTDFLAAVPFLEKSEEVLAIDAMEAGGEPGSLYYCAGNDLAASPRVNSLHGLDLVSMLDLILASRRPKIRVLGVEPERLDFGLTLSPQVAAKLPEIVARARQIAASFGCDTR